MITTYGLNIRIRCIALLCWIGLFITGLGHAITYTYDDLSQLIKVEYEDGSKIEYTYDKAGNILLQVHTKGAAIPVVTITATDPSASEAGSNTGTFTVSRTGGTEAALAVSYTVSGTATPGADYTALPSTVTILAGNPSATLIVTPVDDTTVEAEETVVVTLSSSSSYTVGSAASATVTIADNDIVLSTITLVSPNGGEEWNAGSTQTISWTYTGTPGSLVMIQLLKGGAVQGTLSPGAPIGSAGSGTYTWEIPTAQTPGADYKVRVVSTTLGTCKDTSNGEFTVKEAVTEKPNLTPYKRAAWSDKIVVSNKTGTNTDDSALYTTDSLYVDFAVSNDGQAATAERFYIALYLDGKLNFTGYKDTPLQPNWNSAWFDIAIGSLQAGTYTLKIVADSTGVIAESNESDNEYTKTFTVTTPVAAGITVVSPNGGESWETGSKQTIQWSYTGDPGATVKIQLLKAGKVTRTIATSTSIGANGSGSFAWNIPSDLALATNYTIKVSSTTQTSCKDSSNKVFSIIDALPLTSGKSVNGSVQKGAWKYYKISAPASLAQFKVTLTNVTGDPNLYVKRNAKPGLNDYDSASKHGGEHPESITLANTGEAVWYIGVYGLKASNYTIKADVSADKTVTLTSWKGVAASVALGDWKYYRISAPSDTTQLKVTLTKLTADVDLYLLKSSRPQQYKWDMYSMKYGTLSETITIMNTGENVWYIGVYGYGNGNYTVKAILSKLLTDGQPVEEETLDP